MAVVITPMNQGLGPHPNEDSKVQFGSVSGGVYMYAWGSLYAHRGPITLTKEGNLQQCQNYQTISLISHPGKVMLKIILDG